jgi:hypothetical protein
MTDHDELMELLVWTLGMSRVPIFRLPEKVVVEKASSYSRDTEASAHLRKKQKEPVRRQSR